MEAKGGNEDQEKLVLPAGVWADGRAGRAGLEERPPASTGTPPRAQSRQSGWKLGACMRGPTGPGAAPPLGRAPPHSETPRPLPFISSRMFQLVSGLSWQQVGTLARRDMALGRYLGLGGSPALRPHPGMQVALRSALQGPAPNYNQAWLQRVGWGHQEISPPATPQECE